MDLEFIRPTGIVPLSPEELMKVKNIMFALTFMFFILFVYFLLK